MPRDIALIKRNVGKMINGGASEGEIDSYLSGEGVSAEALRMPAPTTAQPQAQLTQAGPIPWGEVGRGALKNLPSSTVKGVGEMISTLAHPIESAGAIGQLGLGAFEKAIPSGEFLGLPEFPQEKREFAPIAGAAGGYLKEKLGGVENIKRTIRDDPFFALEMASIPLTGGGGAATKLGKLAHLPKLAKAGKVVSKVGRTIEPTGAALRALKKPVGLVKKGAATSAGEILGATTGEGKFIIGRAIKGGKGVRVGRRGKVSTENVVGTARKVLYDMREELGVFTQTKNKELFTAKKSIDITPIAKRVDDRLSNLRIKKGFKGKLDFSDSRIGKADQTMVQEIYNEIRGIGKSKGSRTPLSLDSRKQRLDSFYSHDGKVMAFRNEARDAISKTLESNLGDAYTKANAEYAAMNGLIKDIEQTLKLEPTKAKIALDTTVKKFTSIIKNNEKVGIKLLQEIEKRPGGAAIIDNLAGIALKPIVPVGPLGRVITGVGALGSLAGGGGFLSLPFLAVLGMGSPRLVAKFLDTLASAGQAGGFFKKAGKKAGLAKAPTRQAVFGAGRLGEVTEGERGAVKERKKNRLSQELKQIKGVR